MEHLIQKLKKIDGKGYNAYKDIQGMYEGEWFQLIIDYVQGDPFASPTRIRVKIPQEKANYSLNWFDTEWRKRTLEDYVTREVAQHIKQELNQKRGNGKSGLIYIDSPGQEVIKRTSVLINQNEIDIRLSVGLPAAGRRILGKDAEELLSHHIPDIIHGAIFHLNKERVLIHLQLADQQEAIRSYIKKNGFVAFIANDSILPRESGTGNRPLQSEEVVRFHSPPSLEIEIPIPHAKAIKGMGIPKGITLIVGGGYHGKSTLLKAIERGVYHHIPDDGREYIITDEASFKIRAEDGRGIEKVNISPFISNLPFDKDTSRFSTMDASGSTSQAANIMEALEMGVELLLIDEDTSATNFMIRDERMRRLVSKDKEPITPFIEKVKELYQGHGISTILVIGGSGAYFDVADRVIMMDEYLPYDVTSKAKEISEELKSSEIIPMVYQRERKGFDTTDSRVILSNSLNASRGKKEKIAVKRLTTILYGSNEIDLTYVEQLVDQSQTRAIADMLRFVSNRWVNGHSSLKEIIEQLYQEIKQKGLDIISPYYGQHPGDLALPRKYEVAAAINRMRTLKIK